MVTAMRRLTRLAAAAAIMLALSGCLYKKETKLDNVTAVRESILLVQNAVDTYKQRTGVLPIKNSEASTPIYEKYILDMRKLKDGHYLSQLPSVSYENGGSAIFLLVNAETKPEVRVMDLVAYQQAGDLQNRVKEYQAAHQGQLPVGPAIAPHFYQLDFDKLGMKLPQVESRYSRAYLTFGVHESGTVLIDYAPDLMKLITERSLAAGLNGTTDLRSILVQESPFVPAKSYPYRWKDGQPVLSES
ncbi:hypothetical protein [Paenibacillus sp. HJGM_3]|uniref:hypothetical protein n=1 Tax=Paenibacillus sp. HJGM_3 TaxID=3379816 RepID=UPI00385DB650